MTAQAYVVTIDETTSPVGIAVHPSPSDDLDDVLSVAAADATTKDAALRSALLGGVDSAWDTLQDIKAFVTADETTAAALAATVALKAPIASPTFTGVATAPAFSASGLTGAASAIRLAGRTTSGPPSTGTFLTGDIVMDAAGLLYTCTAGGSPGTWNSTQPGTELAYASTFQVETSTTTGYENFTNSVTITIPTLARPVMIEAFAPSVANSTATNGVFLAIARTQDSSTRGGVFDSATANAKGQITAKWRIPANTPGDTYRLQKGRRVGGTATITNANTVGLEVETFLVAHLG